MSNGHGGASQTRDPWEKYLPQEPERDPFERFLPPPTDTRIIRRKLSFGAAREAAFETPAYSAAFSMIKGMLGFLIGEEEVERLVPIPGASGNLLGEEEVLPRQGALDVTDPSVILEGVELTPHEKGIGFLRRMGAAMGASALQTPPIAQVGESRLGLAFPTYSGIENAVMSGDMRPPQSTADHAADFIGVSLAQLGVLGPLGVGGGLGAKVASAIPGTAGKVVGKNLVSGLGQQTIRRLGLQKTAERIAPFMGPTKTGFKGLPRVEEYIGRLVAETALGAGWGAAELSATTKLPGMEGVDMDWGAPMAIMTAAGAATGLLRVPTTMALGRAYINAGHHLAGLPKEGEVIAGRRAIYRAFNEETMQWVEFTNKEGAPQPKWVWTESVEEGVRAGDIAPPPTAEEAARHVQAAGARLMQEIQDAITSLGPDPDPKTVQARLAQVGRIPPDLLDKAEEISLRSGRYYLDARASIAKWSLPEANNAVLARERIVHDVAGRSLGERLEAAAEIRAIETVFKKTEGTPAGMLPIDEEMNAIVAYRNLLKSGNSNERIYQVAVRQMAGEEGAVPHSKRVAEIARQGGVPARPPTFKDAIADVTKGWNRGIAENADIIYNGKRYKVEGQPLRGVAHARLVGGDEVVPIDLREAIPIPRPGTMVMMKDGAMIEVVGTHSKNKFKGRVAGAQYVSPRSYADIAFAGGDIPEQRLLQAERAKLVAEMESMGLAPARVRGATTRQGEKVTITHESPERVAVQTEKGATRVLPREEVSPIVKPPMGSGVVADFVAGTVPDKNNKILFFTIGKEEAAAFEEALASGTLRETLETHIFPPARPEGGTQLYAIEVPSNRSPVKGYQGEARKAVYKALSPDEKELSRPGVLSSHETEVPALSPEAFAEGRVFRVPEALWSSAMLPDEILQQMTRGEQAEYLKRLLNMHQSVDSDIARAGAERLESVRIASKALSEGKGMEAARALEDATQAEVRAVQAANRLTKEKAQPAIDEMFDAAAMSDPNFGTWTRLVTEGLNDETAQVFEITLDAMPAGRTWLAKPKQTVPDEGWLLHHSKQPGLRAQVHKEQRYVLEPEAGQPDVEEVFRVVPYDARGRLIEEGAETFHTAEAVTRYAMQEGFTEPPTVVGRTAWKHAKNDALGADIYIEGGSVRLNIVEAIDVHGSGKRYTTAAEAVTPEEAAKFKSLYADVKGVTVEYAEGTGTLRVTGKTRADIDKASYIGQRTGLGFDDVGDEYYIPTTKESLERAERAALHESVGETLVMMGESQLDIPSGTYVHVRRAHYKFDSPEEAIAFAREKGFESVDPKNWRAQAAKQQGIPELRYEGTPAERFSKLPALEELEESLQPTAKRPTEAVISSEADTKIVKIGSTSLSSRPVSASENLRGYWLVLEDEETGKRLATANLRIDESTGVAQISVDGEGPGSAGYSKIRTALAGLRELHPEIKSLSGVRTTGSRSGAAAQPGIRVNVKVPLGEASLRVREPAVSHMQLRDTAAGLERIMTEYLSEHNLLPEALHHYARRVYGLYYEAFGDAPFNRRIREALDLVDLENDLSPQLKSQNLFGDVYDATITGMSEGPGSYWDPRKKKWVPTDKTLTERQRNEIGRILNKNEKGDLEQPLSKREVEQLELAYAKLTQRLAAKVESAASPGITPKHAEIFPAEDVGLWEKTGVSFRQEAGQTDPIIAAMEHVRRQRQLDEMSGVYRDLTPGTRSDVDATIYATERTHLARVRDTGEIVEIVEANPAQPSVVRVLGKADEPVEMALNDLDLISPETDRYMVGRLAEERPYESFFSAEPGLGFSEIDKRLGIAGTRSIGLTREKYSARVEELLGSLEKQRGILQGSEENINELLDIFTRAQWLGSIGPDRKFNSLFDDLLKKVPKEMRQSIRRGLYERVREAGGDTPAADLIARAHAGVQRLERDPSYMLTKGQAELIEEWAEAMGMSVHVPLARKAVEVVRRQLEDPWAREVIENVVSYKNTQGFLNFGRHMEHVPADRLRIANRNIKDINDLTRLFGIPLKTARRHPISRMAMNMVYLANEEQAILGKETDLFLRRMTGKGVHNKKDWNDLAAYRREFGSDWEKASKKGARPELREAFIELGEELDRDLDRVIRLQLRGEVHPVKWDPDMLKTKEGKQLLQYLVDEEGIDPATLAESGMIKISAVRSRSHGLNLKGLIRGSINEEEINSLVTARKMYASAADLPEGQYADWIYEEFDFWKSYGIQDYWPNIWEGGMKIEVERAGEKQLIGWAQNRVDGLRIVKALMKEGRLATDADGTLLERVSIGMKQSYVDDVVLKNFQNHADIDKMLKKMTRTVAVGPDEMVGIMMRFSRKPGTKKGAPKMVHGLERTADLRHPIEDGLKDISLYKGRIAAAEYRLKVADAWNFLNNPEVDRAMSAAWGMQP